MAAIVEVSDGGDGRCCGFSALARSFGWRKALFLLGRWSRIGKRGRGKGASGQEEREGDGGWC